MHTSSARGFTLLETLIAVSILALAVSGPLFIASRATIATETARDQLTASYLAQEGIEYVRLMRDNEFLTFYHGGGSNVSTAAWNDFVNGGSAGSITACKASACTVDPGLPMGTGPNLALTPCSGTCAPLTFSSGGLYTQQAGNGTQTIYTRSVQAVDVNASEERVISRVMWTYHGLSYSVTVTDHLTAWQ